MVYHIKEGVYLLDMCRVNPMFFKTVVLDALDSVDNLEDINIGNKLDEVEKHCSKATTNEGLESCLCRYMSDIHPSFLFSKKNEGFEKFLEELDANISDTKEFYTRDNWK